MSKRTTESVVRSSPEWDELDDWLSGSMQKLTLSCGTIELRRQGVWSTNERFESRLLPVQVSDHSPLNDL